MNNSPLRQLTALGQSVWLDDIRRDYFVTGLLSRLIEQDGVSGLTSNPSIFEKSFSSSAEYEDDIQKLAAAGMDALEMYDALSQSDVREAADLLRPLYDASDGRDGYVSLEVNPHHAHDTVATVAEGRRLWSAVDRPNLFVKVPATTEGIPAIAELIGEGINVNVTLLFGLTRYRDVMEAYMTGLETCRADGRPLGRVCSVASFFVSRVDALLDPVLRTWLPRGGRGADIARRLVGQVAVSNARLAYRACEETFALPRFEALAAAGGRQQRLVWASTGTKDPGYSDVKYVEELIGPNTICTLPLETLEAYRGHGRPELRLTRGWEEAAALLDLLPDLGIEMPQVALQLEEEGIEKFRQPFDSLLAGLEEQRKGVAA